MKRFTLTSPRLCACLALYFAIVLNIAFYRQVLTIQPLTGTMADIFFYTLPLMVFCLLYIAFSLLSLPFIHKIIIPLLFVVGAAVSYNSLFLNVYFNIDMLNNVLQTNLAEGSRLITLNFVLWIVFLGVLPALVYVWVKIQYRPWYKEIGWRAGSILLALAVIGLIARSYYQDYVSFFRNHKETLHLLAPSNVIGAGIKKVRLLRQESMPFTIQDENAQQAKQDNIRHVVVLVIGETTRAQNWGLNGYARQTTPKLAARGEEIINFTNVSSCGTATATSLPCIFSSLNRENFSDLKAEKQDNLLDILQRAGVNVLWLENDTGCKGVCTRVPSIDVTSAWKTDEFCHNGECLDNILLSKFDEQLDSSNKDTVIVLHTIGSHGPTYYQRYTNEFRHFTPTCDTNDIHKCSNEQLVNTYDNTIVYVDQFINQVIGKLEKRNDIKSMVIYVSDHGESLGENGLYLHGAPYAVAPETQTKVPMVMWFNRTFRENGTIDFACLTQNARNNAYSHDNFFSTVFGLMNMSVQHSQTYRKELDIMAACKK